MQGVGRYHRRGESSPSLHYYSVIQWVHSSMATTQFIDQYTKRYLDQVFHCFIHFFSTNSHLIFTSPFLSLPLLSFCLLFHHSQTDPLTSLTIISHHSNGVATNALIDHRLTFFSSRAVVYSGNCIRRKEDGWNSPAGIRWIQAGYSYSNEEVGCEANWLQERPIHQLQSLNFSYRLINVVDTVVVVYIDHLIHWSLVQCPVSTTLSCSFSTGFPLRIHSFILIVVHISPLSMNYNESMNYHHHLSHCIAERVRVLLRLRDREVVCPFSHQSERLARMAPRAKFSYCKSKFRVLTAVNHKLKDE